MPKTTNSETTNNYQLYLFSFLIIILTYGFALTNFSLSIDNEIPILPDFGLDGGRWGQNLIKYHLFKGHLQYYTLVLGLFLFSLAAVRLSKLLKFSGFTSYLFCGLFLTFPQISYQVVFSMMADVAALGVLLSVFCVELFLIGFETKFLNKKIGLYSVLVLILVFTLSIYQLLVFVPITIYLILFFQKTFENEFILKLEMKKAFFFLGLILISVILYYFSVKLICPITDGAYLTSYTSGASDNQFLNFISIWLKNLVGGFYYGEKLYLIVTLLSLFLFVRFFIEKKQILIRFTTLFTLLIVPFIASYFITNGYHPPRLYVASNLVFAFVISFVLKRFNLDTFKITKTIVFLIFITNIYFVTNLFYSLNKIYKHDKKIAERIDNIIQNKYPGFCSSEKIVYFYGFFPYEYHQQFRLDKSEIFGGSYYNWDNGNNYRLNHFFKEADVAEYKMIETKENFNIIKDSIEKMPVWPNQESIKMFQNKIVVVKLGKDKGMNISVE